MKGWYTWSSGANGYSVWNMKKRYKLGTAPVCAGIAFLYKGV